MVQKTTRKTQSVAITMHWKNHYKPEKDCNFPFQVYVKENWVGEHPKTEISIKQGDIILVYGECGPDGHNAMDVPRTQKRIHGILDNNYPVFDKTSKMVLFPHPPCVGLLDLVRGLLD